MGHYKYFIRPYGMIIPDVGSIPKTLLSLVVSIKPLHSLILHHLEACFLTIWFVIM